jgi:hypothetical protein
MSRKNRNHLPGRSVRKLIWKEGNGVSGPDESLQSEYAIRVEVRLHLDVPPDRGFDGRPMSITFPEGDIGSVVVPRDCLQAEACTDIVNVNAAHRRFAEAVAYGMTMGGRIERGELTAEMMARFGLLGPDAQRSVRAKPALALVTTKAREGEM